jgi:hypothetical protein
VDPTEKEVEAFLKGLGWKRIPANLQLLPNNLMAPAWWHAVEKVVMVDARPPNSIIVVVRQPCCRLT